jgi:hypothetical protein
LLRFVHEKLNFYPIYMRPVRQRSPQIMRVSTIQSKCLKSTEQLFPLSFPFSKVDGGVFLKSYLRANPDHRGRKNEWRSALAPSLDRRAGAFAGAIIRLLKRVFDIDIEDCPNCGGALKIIAAIEETVVIRKILSQPRSPRPARMSELLFKPT